MTFGSFLPCELQGSSVGWTGQSRAYPLLGLLPDDVNVGRKCEKFQDITENFKHVQYAMYCSQTFLYSQLENRTLSSFTLAHLWRYLILLVNPIDMPLIRALSSFTLAPSLAFSHLLFTPVDMSLKTGTGLNGIKPHLMFKHWTSGMSMGIKRRECHK